MGNAFVYGANLESLCTRSAMRRRASASEGICKRGVQAKSFCRGFGVVFAERML